MLKTIVSRILLFSLCFSCFICEEEPEPEPALARIIRPRCQMDKDCSPNAFCFGNDNYMLGHCKCNDGFEMFSEGKTYDCLEELHLGQKCLKNVQCQVTAGALAICAGDKNDKFCFCNETVSHQVKNRCYETKYLDQFCQVDENCLLPDSPIGEDRFAICASVCSCPIGWKPSQNKKRCLEFRRLGHICETNLQCQLYTENAVCRETCTCEAGFVRSMDQQRCLRAALKFDDPCMEDAQCSAHLEGSICVDKKCSCPPRQHGYLVKCRADTYPGNVCFDVGDCLIFKELRGKVRCDMGVCTCIYGKSYNDDICLPGKSSTVLLDTGVLISSFVIMFVVKVFIY